jgi:hypothetical protein
MWATLISEVAEFTRPTYSSISFGLFSGRLDAGRSGDEGGFHARGNPEVRIAHPMILTVSAGGISTLPGNNT